LVGLVIRSNFTWSPTFLNFRIPVFTFKQTPAIYSVIITDWLLWSVFQFYQYFPG